ncbi:hypothetical protein BJX70DRAFT_367316 [Aspergillus crustosus]
MDNPFFQALTTHYSATTTFTTKMPPSPSLTKEFEKSRPRKKAQGSCLNCQRSHRTCGNERPCSQCIHRGLPLRCIDGNRKPPKYLQEPGSSRERCKKRAANRTTGSESQNKDVRFIDPNVLHTETVNLNSPSILEDMDSNGGFPVALTHSDPSVSSRSNSESGGPETPPQSQGREDASGDDLLAELLAFDVDVDIGTLAAVGAGFNGYSRSPCGIQKGSSTDAGWPSSSGFVISSGWSDTFFPSGVDEELQT